MMTATAPTSADDAPATPTCAARPWEPWCGGRVAGRLGPLDWALTLYVAVLLVTGATAAYKVATYVAYGTALLFLASFPWLHFARVAWELLLSIAMVGLFLLSGVAAAFDAGPATWYLVQVYLMFWMILLRCDSFPRFKALMTAASLGALVVAAAGLLLGEKAVAGESERQVGITQQSNAYGFVLVAGVFSSFILFHMAATYTRLAIGLGWLVFLAAIAGSGSRQAITNVVAMLCTYGLFEWLLHLRQNAKQIVAGLTVLALFGGIGLFYFSDSALAQRIRGTQVGGDSRWQLLGISWDYFLHNPWLGIGPGGMRAYTKFAYTHSSYTELLATTGLATFLLFVALLVSLWLRLRRLRILFGGAPAMRRLFSAMQAVLAGIVTAGFFHLTHSSKIDSALLAAMIGLTATLGHECQRAAADGEPAGAAVPDEWEN